MKKVRTARRYAFTEQEIMGFEDRMKPERFQVMILVTQGYTDEQMAAYLEVPKGTIKSRLSRARTDLAKFERRVEIGKLYESAIA